MTGEKNFDEEKVGDDKMTKRFKTLNFSVTIVLLLAIFISLFHFGDKAWSGKTQFALIIPGKKNNLGWDKSQYLAAKNVCAEMDYELVLRENVPLDFESCRKVTEELSKRGVRGIAFTNGLKLSEIKKLEKMYPRISFETIEIISVIWSDGSYSINAFEGSYLAGIIAGLHTKTGKIGYIAPYSEFEVNQSINAFTLGVKRVNPDAEVLLDWTNTWNNPQSEEAAVQTLKAYHVDILSYHENTDTIPNACERAGINFISYNEVYPKHKFSLAAIKIDWAKVYGEMIKYIKTSDKDGNYFFGVREGIVDIVPSPKLSTRERVAIEEAKWEIKNGRLIFSGDIFDRNDVRKCAANEAIGIRNLQRKMNWLVKGVTVIGS